jgi:hypothetical protein
MVAQVVWEKLVMHNSYKPRTRDVEYMAILTVKEEYQVVRMVCFNKDMKKAKSLLTFMRKLQHWFSIWVTGLSMQ